MSLTELFSQRYAARIGCGELFAEDLHLHDRRALREKVEALHLDPAEAGNEHVNAERALRVQLSKAVANANARRTVKDLPRRARQTMADAYLQANRADLSGAVEAEGFEHFFDFPGEVSALPPIKGDKWTVDANLLVFDFIEAFFDLLPSEEQLEFSRDLNQRLQRGASRWYFQLGRWRRDDWPRERDGSFDQILFSLKRQADLALEAHRNRVGENEEDQPDTVDPEAASQALLEAARSLWEADRLLASDLLSDKVRHGAAVRAARRALDQCLTHFRGMVRGPFVQAKPPRAAQRGGFGGLVGGRRGDAPSRKALEGVGEPLAAAIRLKRLGHWLANGGPGLSREDRLKVLERANLAEFMARLILFGLPTEDGVDPDDAEAEEVRRYSKLTATEAPVVLAGKRLNHGQGALHLQLADEAAARLAVDVLARLCQFTTGAASTPGEVGYGPDRDPLLADGLHPRARDMANARLFRRIVTTAGFVLGAGGLLGVGVVIGLLIG